MMDINIDIVRKKIVEFIRKYISDSNVESIVLGLSGGLDSSVVVYLCVEALGSDKVYALYLPYGKNREAETDSKWIADKLNINYNIFDITPLVDLYFKNFPDADKIRRGNMMARLRMAILFDYSKIYDGLVAGTGNKSEFLLGYFTLFGDAACSIAPLGDLYKTEVKELAKILGVPSNIIDQKPSAGLWSGQTDEGELGFSYEEADKILYLMEEKKYNIKHLINEGFDKDLIYKIKRQIDSNAFKNSLPVIPKINR